MSEVSMEPRKVRDEVHGYVTMTGIERVILESPLAQRLRYIGQSSAAQLVFPSMTVTRFAHSLGSMHLASRFYRASLRNSIGSNGRDPDFRVELMSCLLDLVNESDEHVLTAEDTKIRARESKLRAQGLRGISSNDVRKRLASLIVEQALRLVTLLHDLGHLPFSHDFEYALKDCLTVDSEFASEYPNLASVIADQPATGQAIHEQVGKQLTKYLRHEVINEHLEDSADAPLRSVATAAISVASTILNSQASASFSGTKANRIARWLYNLVAGEIDADRCDYILRDARGYGVTGATFDLDRLIDNLCVYPEGDEDTREYKVGVLTTGVSVAEEFFVARFRLYQWAVYHHKIQQASAGLRLALRRELLDPSGDFVTQFLENLDAVLAQPNETGVVRAEVRRFADYDDHGWLEYFKEKIRSVGWVSKNGDVVPWLKLFIYRTSGPRSLWKRPSDLSSIELETVNRAYALYLSGEGDIPGWNRKVRELEDEGFLVVPLKWKPWDIREVPELQEAELSGHGASASMSGASPASQEIHTALKQPRAVSAFQVVNPRNGERMPLSEASALVESLWQAWDNGMKILIFADSQDTVSGLGPNPIGTLVDGLLDSVSISTNTSKGR